MEDESIGKLEWPAVNGNGEKSRKSHSVDAEEQGRGGHWGERHLSSSPSHSNGVVVDQGLGRVERSSTAPIGLEASGYVALLFFDLFPASIPTNLPSTSLCVELSLSIRICPVRAS